MYVKEAAWYQKQQRQRSRGRWMHRIALAIAMLLCVCFGVVLGSWDKEKRNVNAQTISSFVSQSLLPVEILPVGTEESMAEVEGVVSKGISGNVVTGMPVTEEIKVEAVQSEDTVKYDSLKTSETAIAKGNELEAEQKYRIAIDPGHGGEDEGCSFHGVEEKSINLEIALLLQKKLENMGFEVVLTRADDRELTLEERVATANRSQADAFISIHQNSCGEKSAHGVETWYCASGKVVSSEENERLAKLVQQYTVLYSKARDRGVREEEELYVIREGNMPSCLIETGFLSNEKERTSLQKEEYCERLAQGIADGVQLYFYPKVMYLTFDDGPVAGNTERVLDILKEKGVKATFFVVGENVERNPQLAKRIVDEGHTIGIHCYHHDYKKLYVSADSYLKDFEKARQAVYEATGVDAKLFRFPGGSINSYNKKVYQEIISEMTEKGYIYHDWNASLEDAVKNPKAEKLIQNAKESTLGRKKVVMLAHDIVEETGWCLDELIEAFPEYEMRMLEEDVEPIRF